ncbi:hypothetical protein L7F22_060973 [Adiantum nelumboides]|nr:hypothetical protein [Adiantum nelumboides]
MRVAMESPHCGWERKVCSSKLWLKIWTISHEDPPEADKSLKIQKELDETKHISYKTVDTVLERKEKLDSLVEKSSDHSLASQLFYKQQGKKTNQCCIIL